MPSVVQLKSGHAKAEAKRPARFAFKKDVARLLLRYAHMVAARGYVHNSLGNIAIRAAHPGWAEGVAYTKHSGVSLEEMTLDNVVVTDIPTGAMLYGEVPTSVGHKLNREIFRLRPDINAVIHVHHDETIAFLAAGAFKKIEPVSVEFAVVMGKPPHILPSHVNVELDVGPLKDFIADTNAVIMLQHGVTTLGRHVSEAYHRLNTLASEVRRIVMIETLAALKNSKREHVSAEELEWMYRSAESIVYPKKR